MKHIRILLICVLLMSSLWAFAQGGDIRKMLSDNPYAACGTSGAYQYEPGVQHAAPKGYKPFYVSHFGRHGSRYHTTGTLCPEMASKLRMADSLGLLTERGKAVYKEIASLDSASRGRTGDLTAVGMREHRQIAGRMYKSCPQVLEGRGKHISAQSTTSPRVIISMASFCEELKLRNRNLDIFMESGDATAEYLNHYTPEYREYYDNGPWRAVRDQWQRENECSAGTMAVLFKDASLFDGSFDSHSSRRFVQNLYGLAKIAPACGYPMFFDVFPEDELVFLWQSGNLDQYLRKGPTPLSGGLNASIAKPLLEDFVEKADAALEGHGNDADLRFGHGEGIIPLAALMQMEEASGQTPDASSVGGTWQDYRVSPMAANIQWIFYRNRHGDVLVKVLLNEREMRLPVETGCWPFYRWEDLRAHCMDILAR